MNNPSCSMPSCLHHENDITGLAHPLASSTSIAFVCPSEYPPISLGHAKRAGSFNVPNSAPIPVPTQTELCSTGAQFI